MLWVEMEVNSGAVKHMVELIWCVDEVDDTTWPIRMIYGGFGGVYKRGTLVWNGGWYSPDRCS